MKRFLLLAVFIPHIIFAEDIAFTVTQDTYLSDIDNNMFKTKIKKDEIVYFYGDIIQLVDRVDYVMCSTETEGKGSKGRIDNRSILLKGSVPLPDSITNKEWIFSYYQDIILEQAREILYKYEPFYRDEWEEYLEKDFPLWDVSWWEVYRHVSFEIHNNLMWINISGGGYSFIYTKVEQGINVIILQIICVAKDEYKQNYFRDIFYKGEAYRLIFKIDGDYMDVFLNNEATKLCTLISVDDYFIQTFNSIIEGKLYDLSKVHFPQRADGNMVYPSELSNDAFIAEEAENAENATISNDDKNQASSLPLWAWFVFIGIAVAVSGGVAVFVVRRKK